LTKTPSILKTAIRSPTGSLANKLPKNPSTKSIIRKTKTRLIHFMALIISIPKQTEPHCKIAKKDPSVKNPQKHNFPTPQLQVCI
jgi:hypothetical protein